MTILLFLKAVPIGISLTLLLNKVVKETILPYLRSSHNWIQDTLLILIAGAVLISSHSIGLLSAFLLEKIFN